MRAGKSPEAACLAALERLVGATRVPYLLDAKGRPSFDVKFYAVNKDGETGSAAIWSGANTFSAPSARINTSARPSARQASVTSE